MNLKQSIVLLAAMSLSACTTINPYTGDEQTAKATKGALIGAGIGVLAGVISGDNSRERRKRALRAAGIGAIAGGSVGYYMDVREAKLRKELADTGIVFQRQGNNIVMAMQGAALACAATGSTLGEEPMLDYLEQLARTELEETR